MCVRRGEIYYIYPGASIGSEQRSGRPGIIVSNEANNQSSATVEVVYTTTQPKKDLPTHVCIRSTPQASIALCEQIHTVAVERIGDYIGRVSNSEMEELEIGMAISLELDFLAATPQEKNKIRKTEMAPPITPPDSDVELLRSSLRDMTIRYETMRQMYDSLLATLLAARK